jgi:hypothetical protein
MQNISTNVLYRGEITARFYDQSSLNWFDRKSNEWLSKMRTRFPRLMRYYRLGKLIRQDKHKNVICNAGFNKVCHALGDNNSHNLYINKMALGTGAGTPAAADVALYTEAYRNDTASATDAANVVYLTAYYTEIECNGTYTEFGNFIGGGAGADSGSLWSHIAGLNWVKSNTIVLVVSCKYTHVSA